MNETNIDQIVPIPEFKTGDEVPAGMAAEVSSGKDVNDVNEIQV